MPVRPGEAQGEGADGGPQTDAAAGEAAHREQGRRGQEAGRRHPLARVRQEQGVPRAGHVARHGRPHRGLGRRLLRARGGRVRHRGHLGLHRALQRRRLGVHQPQDRHRNRLPEQTRPQEGLHRTCAAVLEKVDRK